MAKGKSIKVEKTGYNPGSMKYPKDPTAEERQAALHYQLKGFTELQAYAQEWEEPINYQDWKDKFNLIEALRKNHFPNSPELKDFTKHCLSQGITSLNIEINEMTNIILEKKAAAFRSTSMERLTAEQIGKYWLNESECVKWLQEIQKAIYGSRIYRSDAPALVHRALNEVVVPFWAKTVSLGIKDGLKNPNITLKHLYSVFAQRIYPYDPTAFDQTFTAFESRINQTLAEEGAAKNGEVLSV